MGSTLRRNGKTGALFPMESTRAWQGSALYQNRRVVVLIGPPALIGALALFVFAEAC